MNHRLKLAIAIALVVFLPISVLLSGASLPALYGETYYSELPVLWHRLTETQGQKLVLIGGSSVAFGVDTALLEETLNDQGYPFTVCPFGLYAAVGTSAMLDLALDTLEAGDVVVLTVEPTSETMSTYFGATAFWKCCESTPELLLHLSKDKQAAMVGNYIPYLQERISLLSSGVTLALDGVYAKSSFDDRGNLVYHREGNTMALGYDTSAPVTLGDVTIEEAFAQQVNDFCSQATAKGATVYFSFAPINRSALTDEAEVQGYFDLCNQTFDCPIISDPNRYILDSGWFYDSNFHLNTAGSNLRTQRLCEDILAALGCYTALDWDTPEMPSSIAQVEENQGVSTDFTYEALGEGWLVSGLATEALEKTSLTVPSSWEGKPVVGFTEDALKDAKIVEELTLPQSIESIPDGLFQNCNGLKRLVLEHTKRLCAIGQEPFAGADQIKIFVPSESYALYRDGDGCEANPWSAYLDRIYPY